MNHLRNHSTASSTGSLTDDLALFSSLPTSSSPADFSSYAYGAPGAGDASLSDIDSPYPGISGSRQHSRRPSVVASLNDVGLESPHPNSHAGGRSRARAFSFLSVHHDAHGYGAKHGDGLSPATGETPVFGGGGYDDALDADDTFSEDDDDEGVEMQPKSGGAGGGGMGAGRTYRARFQPLEGHELALMGVSAAAVLGLTVGAVVLTWVG
ncbi:hypothetical protein JCM10207_002145 [Rhodosporidiobolus poonsookiae]